MITFLAICLVILFLSIVAYELDSKINKSTKMPNNKVKDYQGSEGNDD